MAVLACDYLKELLPRPFLILKIFSYPVSLRDYFRNDKSSEKGCLERHTNRGQLSDVRQFIVVVAWMQLQMLPFLFPDLETSDWLRSGNHQTLFW